MIRKYYDTAVAEPAGGGAAEPIVATPTAPEMAAILAKSGVKISDDSVGVDVPDVKIPQVKVDPPAVQEPAKVDPPPTQQPAAATEPAKTVPPAQAQPAATQQQSPPATPAKTDWKEALKAADTNDVLKELGFSDKMIGFINQWKKDGNVTNYLETVNADYSKMSSEEVMRRHLREENPELSDEDFKEYYAMMVTDKYKLNADQYSETEVKRGNMLLNVDAKKLRQGFIDRQTQTALEKPPAQADPQKTWMDQQNQAINNYNKQLTESPATTGFLSSKKLTVGTGADAFSFEADADKIVNSLKNPAEWAKLLYNQDGSPEVEKQLLVAAFAHDPENFLAKYAEFHKGLGGKSITDIMDNASEPNKTKPAAGGGGPKTPAEAMAAAGQMTFGN